MPLRRPVTFLTALILVLVATASPAAADPLAPQIHTVAGGGTCSGLMSSGGPCDNKSATSVPIGDASSVSAVPGGGFLYVDSTNDLVRQVSPKGTVTTVAGMIDPTTGRGVTTDAPDGSLAVQSGLSGPVAVAALPQGGFLITEYNGAVVRMVTPGTPATAQIFTIAGTGTPGHQVDPGGQATATQLAYPTDAEVTADGQVLIADSGNGLIREVSAAAPGATISTVAGGGSCDDRTLACEGTSAGAVSLHDPVSVSPIQGGSGGFLIAEADNTGANAVRRIAPDGTFTTVAGVPGQLGGYSGDGGPATAALLASPHGVTSMPDGSFLIADTINQRVRQVSPSGTITTVAGNGVATSGGDGGNATDASVQGPAGVSPYPTATGYFLIADEKNATIREVTLPPTSTVTVGPSSELGNNGWYVFSPVTATVTTTEKATIACELDPPSPPPVFAAITSGCPFKGSGGQVTGDGVHTLWVAGANSIGDDENPISATVKIDTGTPTITCQRAPSFRFGSGRHTITAAVADTISGPLSPVVSARVKTTRAGSFTVSLSGANQAGTPAYADCPYTVRPKALTPAPAFDYAVLSGRSYATVKRLLVVHVAPAAAVNITCHGSGCPFKKALNVTGHLCQGRPCVGKKRKGRGKARTVDLTALLAGGPLSPRVQLTVSVTAPNTVGRVWELTLRAGQSPAFTANCLEPGSTVPGRGCASTTTGK